MKSDHLAVSIVDIDRAAETIRGVVKHSALEYNERLSKQFGATIYFKREDTQIVRSYKIRGAYNFISGLSDEQRKQGIVCASAGNHAQGVALAAKLLHIKATIYMPTITPLQKIARVKHIGEKWVNVELVGKTFDECNQIALASSKASKHVYVPPFDDYKIIAGQGTVGKEIYDELAGKVDIIICPIGGGGLVSGVSAYIKNKNSSVDIIGVEARGAAAMDWAVKKGKVTALSEVDTFVDGAAVKKVSERTFPFVKKFVKKIIIVPVGKICMAMVDLYQNEGIIAEPAGALAVSALDDLGGSLSGKVVVCIISGGNNDILRYPEIMEKSLMYQGLRHYLLIEFAQKPGQLRAFVDKVLGPTDDIIRFEYLKKTSKEKGAALVGIELLESTDLKPLLARMDQYDLSYTLVNEDALLYSHLV